MLCQAMQVPYPVQVENVRDLPKLHKVELQVMRRFRTGDAVRISFNNNTAINDLVLTSPALIGTYIT